jgi:hypothetical protein
MPSHQVRNSKLAAIAGRVLLLLACWLCPAGLIAAPTITYVQGNYATPQSPQSTVTVPFTAAQAGGDLNVVVVGWDDTTATVSSVTDQSGNVYTRAVGPTLLSGSVSQSIYYAKNIAAAAAGANTVTVTFSQAATYPDIRILEYSGADPNNPVDTTAAGSGTSTMSTTGLATTTNPTDLIVGANFVVSHTQGPGSGFTQRMLTSPDGNIAEDEMVSSVGSYSASAPLIYSGGWVMQMVAFRTPVLSSGSFTLSTSPNSLNVTPGNQGTSTITTAVGSGFNSSISLSASGAPSGTTVSFNPSTIAAPGSGTSTMTITVGSNTPAGTYSITVTGSGGGVQQTATVTLTVTVSSTTITYVQGNYATPQSPQSTVTVPFTAAQAGGDLNVVVVGWDDTTATVSSVTDQSGNVYTRAVGPTLLSGSVSQSIYYAKNIAAAAAGANTVTVTFSQAATYPDIRILEYSGADPNNPVDTTAAGSGTSTMSTTGLATTTNPTDLIVGANFVVSHTQGPGSGFTQRMLTSPDGNIAEDEMVSSVGSYSASAPLIYSGGWVMQMVAFRTPVLSSGSFTLSTSPNSLNVTPGNQGTSTITTAVGSGFNSSISLSASGAPSGTTVSFNPSTIAAPGSGTSTMTITVGSNTPAGTYSITVTGSGGGVQQTATVTLTTTPVTISPHVSVVTFTQTQQFTSTGGTGTVSWSVDGVLGGSSSSGTITTSGLYTPPSSVGNHTVTATTSQGQSASAIVYITNYPGTFTYHNDNMRTGVNSDETVLTPANVNQNQFGRLFSYPLDGIAFASPLYVANVNIPGQGYHNVVYVATENDSVYAFDADGRSSAPLWHDSFLGPGVTPIPCADTGDCADIPTQMGITGTPVIDPSSGTLYVVAATKKGTNYVQRLHALDITTGAEKFGGPVVIQATVPGTGDGSSGGSLPFDPLTQNQRAGLLLNNGVVYIAFGSHADYPPYHGWVFGYNATSLQQVMVYNVTPNGSQGGIWQGGGGLSTDSTGDIYFTTGNGTFDVDTGGVDYGDSVVKLSPTGSVVDYFTPYNQSVMDSGDLDFGSGGPVLLLDQSGGTYPHLFISAGKTGTIYVVNRDNMGHYNASNNNQIVQSLPGALPSGGADAGNYSTPAYFDGYVYFGAVNDNLKAFQMSNGLLTTLPTSQSPEVYPCRGGSFAVSANGTTNGILWAIQNLGQPDQDNTIPGVLIAYDATNLAHELYNSNQAGSRDTMDYPAKFSIPLVANGKVFVAGQTELVVYGLLP